MKPYPKYKDSGAAWLGKVPKHWEVVRLGSQFSERNQKVSDVDFKPLSVTKKGILPQLESAAKSKDGDNRKKVCAGDFVINSRSDRKGSSGISPHTGSVSLINTVISSLFLDARYVHNFFRSHAFQEEFYRMGHGIVSDLWSTKYEDMRKINIPVLPLEEQQQIARYLDWRTSQINQFINAKRELIVLLREKKQVVINDAVTKGINPNAAMRDSGVEWLGEIPSHWETQRLKNLANVKASNVDKHSLDGEVSVSLCNYVDVYKNEKITKKLNFMQATAKAEEIASFQIKANDVIITKDSEDWEDIAVPAFVSENLKDVVCGYHLSLVRPKDKEVLGSYLCYAFLSSTMAHQFRVAAKGVTRYGLSQGAINTSIFAIPPLDEQKQIVQHIETETAAITQAISRAEREIDLIQEYRTRLVSDVVTGKVDVRDIKVPKFEKVDSYAKIGDDDLDIAAESEPEYEE